MAAPLLFLFIVVPLLEIFVLIQVGSWIGAIPTVGLLVLAAVLGIVLMRWRGLALVRRVREQLARGELPATDMLEGIMVVVSGILLLVPGFLTDVVGLILLVPWLRRLLVLAFLARRGVFGARRPSPPRTRGPHTIEGEYRREDDPRN